MTKRNQKPSDENHQQANVESTDTSSVAVVEDNTNDEILVEALAEELVNHKESFFSKTKTIVALLITGVFLIGLLIFAIYELGLQSDKNGTVKPVDTISEPSTPATPPTEAEIIEKENLASSSNSETVNIIGEQLAIQYGASVYENVTLASATDNVDEEGKPAFVALATYANIPTDFNVENSANFFIDQLRDIPGDWVYIEETQPPLGVDSIYALKMFDQSENPQNPTIIEILYFVETPQEGNAPTLTITIVSTVY